MSKNRRPSRRTVLIGSAVVAAVAATGKAGAQAPAVKLLKPTPEQVEGPYFLDNSPLNDTLIEPGDTGQVIKISGRVLGVDGAPINQSTVHIWLADSHGHYDNDDGNGGAHPIPLADQHLRGRVVTNFTGEYSFTAIRPGNYPLGNGMMRPAHIHVRIEAKGYKRLITQLYFTDDPFNTKDLPGDGFFKPELLVPLQAAVGGVQEGKFDFVIVRK